MTVTTFHVGEVNLPTTNAFRFRPFTLSPPAPIYVPPAGIDVFQIKQVLLPKAASITSSPSSKGPVEFSRQPKLCLHSHKKKKKTHYVDASGPTKRVAIFKFRLVFQLISACYRHLQISGIMCPTPWYATRCLTPRGVFLGGA